MSSPKHTIQFIGNYASLKALGFSFIPMYANNYKHWEKESTKNLHSTHVWKKGSEVTLDSLGIHAGDMLAQWLALSDAGKASVVRWHSSRSDVDCRYVSEVDVPEGSFDSFRAQQTAKWGDCAIICTAINKDTGQVIIGSTAEAQIREMRRTGYAYMALIDERYPKPQDNELSDPQWYEIAVGMATKDGIEPFEEQWKEIIISLSDLDVVCDLIKRGMAKIIVNQPC